MSTTERSSPLASPIEVFSHLVRYMYVRCHVSPQAVVPVEVKQWRYSHGWAELSPLTCSESLVLAADSHKTLNIHKTLHVLQETTILS